jgi:serine/threonine-protein phosphatase PP1 catalytic subunit
MARSLDRLLGLLLPASVERRAFVRLDLADLQWLCAEATRALGQEPAVLHLDAPINVVGDIHGQYFDLLELLALDAAVPAVSYLFLGDFVDRGRNSIETLALLLALKLRYPARVWLLRGNHETDDVSRLYGFLAECAERYTEALWAAFNDVFRYLPLAAVVSERIFCVHGGLSPALRSVDALQRVRRPVAIGDDGLLADLVWADPSPEHRGFRQSDRGVSFTFGADVAADFLARHDFDLLCRGHQCVPNGYEFPFAEKNVLTIFSARDYCDDAGNDAAVMKVSEDLKCRFLILASRVKERPARQRPRTPPPPAAPPARQPARGQTRNRL